MRHFQIRTKSSHKSKLLFTTLMHITLYKSALCPRCYLAGLYLQEIASLDPKIRIEEVDVMVAPRQSWDAGIRMIPALKINDRILSALFMSRTSIADFIASNRH